MITTLPSFVAILALAIATGYLLVRAKGYVFLKMILILALPLFAFAHWKSLPSYLGWPEVHAIEEIPDEFNFLSAEVVEPNKRLKTEGYIYFTWYPMHEVDKRETPDVTRDPLAYKGTGNPPRYWEVPYFRPLHETMSKAFEESIKKGKKAVIGRKGKGKGKGDGKEGKGEGEGQGKKGKDGKEGEGRSGKGSHSQEQEFMTYPLPPPKPPSKDE